MTSRCSGRTTATCPSGRKHGNSVAENLEAPGTDDDPAWARLYRSRGDEVEANRPVFTGDVFADLTVHSVAQPQNRTILVVQHPCALRSDGVDLVDRIMVAEVLSSEELKPSDWTGYTKMMPLPDLKPDKVKGRHFAAHFKKLWLVADKDFDLSKRIACLSQTGVNLLLQRWVHHNSRAIIPTADYQNVSSPQYAEADIIEDWCEERVTGDRSRDAATAEAHQWLRSEAVGHTGKLWQDLLDDPQTRSSVERAKQAQLKLLRHAD